MNGDATRAPDRPSLLQLVPDLPAAQRTLLCAHYRLIEPRPETRWSEHLDERDAARVRAVLVRGGQVAVSAADMDRLPHLGLIACLGAGMERVDVDAARARDVVVTNGSGANADCVADHAIGLAIALVRDFRGGDLAARSGRWQSGLRAAPQVCGKSMGIVGLGRIGQALARRAEAFGMSIAYFGRTQQAGSPWPRAKTLVALARQSDILVCTLPGGEGTRHLLDATVFEALGPDGYVVNVGRGSAVCTDDLVDALERGRVAGAALDVLETEPQVPPRLAALSNVLLTPHLAGRSPESTAATWQRAVANLTAFARGESVESAAG